MSRGKGKGCLISFLVFFVFVGGTILGVTLMLRSNIPQQVKFDDKDTESFYEKANINEDDYDFDMMDLLTGNIYTDGQVPVDTAFTSEELTAFLQGHSRDEVSAVWSPLTLTAYAKSYSGKNLLTDFNARILGKDTLELFANVSEDIDDIYEIIPGLDKYAFAVDRAAGANLHFVLDLTFDKKDGFEVTVEEMHIGGVPVPTNLIDDYEPQMTELLNNALEYTEIFVIEEFEITKDEIRFKGTLPASIEAID